MAVVDLVGKERVEKQIIRPEMKSKDPKKEKRADGVEVFEGHPDTRGRNESPQSNRLSTNVKREEFAVVVVMAMMVGGDEGESQGVAVAATTCGCDWRSAAFRSQPLVGVGSCLFGTECCPGPGCSAAGQPYCS